MDLNIKPAKSIQGSIEVPGDKSVSHRALIFGSICDGEVEVSNFCDAQDCLSTLKILRDIGVNIERANKSVLIKGVAKKGFKAPANLLDVGNSGTTLRILPGLLSAQSFNSTLVGDSSISKRPMNRIIEPLSKMGAVIKSRPGGLAPIKIIGQGALKPISYKTPVPSAQIKSALLLGGLYTDGFTEITEEFQSRNHSELMLKYLEASLEIKGTTYIIDGKSKLSPKPVIIPGDLSSAAFFIIASLLLKDSKLEIKNLGVNPTRTGALSVLDKAGANIFKKKERDVNNEPIADITITSSKLKPFTLSAKEIPLLIDEIPILAVAATQINGKSVISGARELRVKESDRLKAISTQLKLMGAKIEEKEDGLIIEGSSKLKGSVVDSGGDHRMAMSLAVAGLLAEGETTIKGAECVDTSFPGFIKLLKSVIK